MLLFESLRELVAGLFSFAQSVCCGEDGSDGILDEAGNAELCLISNPVPTAADAPVGDEPLPIAADAIVGAGLGDDRSEG